MFALIQIKIELYFKTDVLLQNRRVCVYIDIILLNEKLFNMVLNIKFIQCAGKLCLIL